MKSPVLLHATIFLLLLISFSTTCHGALQYGFYRGKCGTKDVEAIIAGAVLQRFFADSKIVAALIRMQFHDCFVNGCDASILLYGPFSKKTAPPNLSVFGYDLIDRAKAAVETACPGVVSCADIIIAATRDAIALIKQINGTLYSFLKQGRRIIISGSYGKEERDYLTSRVNLPSPSITVPQSIQVFQSKGLNTYDMVLLLCGHTVGVTHCSIIRDRLYNFRGTGKPDPSLNPIYVQILSNMVYPRFSNFNNFVFLDDPSIVLKVDNNFYKQLLQNKGIFPIDQALASDWSTRWIVQQLAGNSNLFLTRFSHAMVKVASVQVLTGTQGQIRRNCRRIN